MNNFERIYNLVEAVYQERYPEPKTFWASVMHVAMAPLRRGSIAGHILPPDEASIYYKGMQAREVVEANLKKEREQEREMSVNKDIEEFWRRSL